MNSTQRQSDAARERDSDAGGHSPQGTQRGTEIGPVEAVVVIDDGETLGYFVRGHVEKDLVIAAVKKTAIEDGMDEREIGELPEATHERWRKVPLVGHDSDFRYVRNAAGPGSFRVTHVEVSAWR